MLKILMIRTSTNIFKTMEKKLYFYIMVPAMILSWIFGLILISIIGFDVLSTTWDST